MFISSIKEAFRSARALLHRCILRDPGIMRISSQALQRLQISQPYLYICTHIKRSSMNHFYKTLLGKLICLVLLMLSIASQANAQISLPFSTGFGTTAEQDQWTQYKLGDNNSFYSWEFTSIQQTLAHFYPVGGMELSNNWMVSDAFDFSQGAVVDSIRFEAGGFGLPFGVDTVAMYVISGSQHPDSASSRTLLKLFTDSTYENNRVYKTFYSIPIPATTGSSYIAFRYQTVINWLDVNIDDLAISGFSGINRQTRHVNSLTCYPNPTSTQLTFESDVYPEKICIYNTQGQTVLIVESDDKTINVAQLKTGLYFVNVYTHDGVLAGKFIKK